MISLAARADCQRLEPRGVLDVIVADTALVPIPDAVVSLEGFKTTLLTGANGRFRFLALPPGLYEVRVRKLGFVPTRSRLEVTAADTNRIAITLQASVVLLDSVRVAVFASRGRLDEFEERRAHGEGQYLTAVDIERRNSMNVMDLILPLKGIARNPKGQAMNRRYGVIRDCPLQVFIDDVLIPTPDLENFVSPKDLAGIEVYVSIASVPLRYKAAGNASACGVILLWTNGEHNDTEKIMAAVTSSVHISLMLAVTDAPAAVAWYKRALGATELWSLGSVAGLELSGAPFFVGEPAANGWESPTVLGITSARVEVFCDDPDALIARALAEGAKDDRAPIQDHEAPWGIHRQGGFTDPFGHIWLVGDRSPLTKHG